MKAFFRHWLRLALIAIPLTAILAALIVFQPWNLNSNPQSVLAKTRAVAEDDSRDEEQSDG
jgi:hypothetical protein